SAVLLLPTVYFTFSRGAWLALVAGLAAWILLDPRRLQFLVAAFVLAPPAAIAVWLCSRSEALTRANSSPSAATSEGHRLALWIVILSVAGAGAAVALAYAERRVSPGRRARKAFA